MSDIKFKVGDKVVSKKHPERKGTITKVVDIPKRGFDFGDFQLIYLDNNKKAINTLYESWVLQK